MHLVGPYLTTTNYKKRKNTKFKSAEHKRRYLEQQAEWEKLKAKYDIKPVDRTAKRPATVHLKDNYNLQIPPDRDSKRIPSLRDTGTGVCAKPAPKIYTGDKLIGIATMHKSNMVPVFKVEDAEDIARMRR